MIKVIFASVIIIHHCGSHFLIKERLVVDDCGSCSCVFAGAHNYVLAGCQIWNDSQYDYSYRNCYRLRNALPKFGKAELRISAGQGMYNLNSGYSVCLHSPKSLQDISPDLGRFIIEYAFGDIYTRDGLDVKSREIAVVAALTAMGTARPQLKVHMNGALNTGSSINEIKEVILQMSVYAGFPAGINGTNILKDVVNKRQKENKSR